jgi:hypothetical protein
MSDERKENYSPGCSINDLRSGDSLYVQKNESGYVYTYFCQLLSFKAGIVKVKVIDREWKFYSHAPGEIITARIDKCYLWGISEGAMWPCCHWFRKDEKGVWRVD